MWREGLCEILPETSSRGSIIHFVLPNADGNSFFIVDQQGVKLLFYCLSIISKLTKKEK